MGDVEDVMFSFCAELVIVVAIICLLLGVLDLVIKLLDIEHQELLRWLLYILF